MSDFNIDSCLERLFEGKLIDEDEVKTICEKIVEIFDQEKTVLTLTSPITICGDIHGQYYDLKKLFETGGNCPDTKYLFMGDYVDRGYECVETILLLFALKLKYPNRIYLLRGNHETRHITQIYGFYDDTIRKYKSFKVWKYCVEAFDFMTLAAIIDQKIFCVHGGISKYGEKMDDIKKVDRIKEVPHDGLMCDLLWNDPDPNVSDWAEGNRGCGHLFGEKKVIRFNQINGIDLICRAHQMMNEGYRYLFNNKLVTVWSSPDYCYKCDNIASILKIEGNERKFTTFTKSDDPKRSEKPTELIPVHYF